MPDVRIEYKVDKSQLEAAKKELKELKKETGINSEQADKMNKRYKDLAETTKETTGEMKGFKGQLSGVGEGLEGVGGGASVAAGGVSKLAGAFKALLANPIVATIAAIAAAVGTLTKAFLDSQAGMDTVAREQARLNAMWKVARDRLNEYTKAVNESSKEQGGWGRLITNALNAFGQFIPGLKSLAIEMQIEGQAAADMADKLGDLELATSRTNVVIAENFQKIQELLIITRDMTKSRDEQRRALEEANKLELENLELMEEELALKIKLLEEEIEREVPTNEQLIELDQLRIEFINLKTGSLARQREILNRVNEQENRFLAEDKARHAEEMKQLDEKRRKEAEAIKIEEDAQLRLRLAQLDFDIQTAQDDEERFRKKQEKLTEHYQKELELAGNNKTLIKAIEQEFTNDMVALTEERLDEIEQRNQETAERELILKQATVEAKQNLQQQELNAVASFFGILSQYVDEESELGRALLFFEKTMALAQVAIDLARNNAMVPTHIIVPGYLGTPISVPNPGYATAIAANELAAAIQAGTILSTIIPEFTNNSQPPTFHTGGYVEGDNDEVHALLQTGEFVMRRDAVSKYGLPVLEALNDMEIPAQRLSNDVRVTNLGDLSLQQFTLDEDGLHRWVTKRGNRMKYLNKRNL